MDWLFPGINVKTIKNVMIELRTPLDLVAGGLTKINKWKTRRKKFFIPVKVLAKKFRGKMLYFLSCFF
jgi:hypothetical protein